MAYSIVYFIFAFRYFTLLFYNQVWLKFVIYYYTVDVFYRLSFYDKYVDKLKLACCTNEYNAHSGTVNDQIAL